MVLFFSDSVSGGAAVACRRLVQELQHRDGEAVKWVAARPEGDALAQLLPQKRKCFETFIARYCGRWETRMRLLHKSRQRKVAERFRKTIGTLKPAIVNIHNIHEATDFSLFASIPGSSKLVWTLHDMWPLTGYCCYSYECRKYLDGCQGECPQAKKWGLMTTRTAAGGWAERSALLERLRGRLSFVAPSSWLADAAKARFRGLFDIQVIPYGLDLKAFRPLSDSCDIRNCLGLPLEHFLVLTGAQRVHDPRKGGQYLRESVSILAGRLGKPVTVVAFGDVGANTSVPENWVLSGRVRDERMMNLYYNACDVFVHPALADNLPNTLVEATAAGLPSVTFDVGGCGEIVRHMKTGYVAKYKDVADLANGIEWVLSRPEHEATRLRNDCRQIAEREYDVKLMADRYDRYFQSLVSGP